jgi:hypothetical protein
VFKTVGIKQLSQIVSLSHFSEWRSNSCSDILADTARTMTARTTNSRGPFRVWQERRCGRFNTGGCCTCLVRPSVFFMTGIDYKIWGQTHLLEGRLHLRFGCAFLMSSFDVLQTLCCYDLRFWCATKFTVNYTECSKHCSKQRNGFQCFQCTFWKDRAHSDLENQEKTNWITNSELALNWI